MATQTEELDKIAEYLIASMPFFDICMVNDEYKVAAHWTNILWLNPKRSTVSTIYLNWRVGKKRMARILEAIATVQAEREQKEQASA